MFYSESLRQRVLGGKRLLEMGGETRAGNQDASLHLEERGVCVCSSKAGFSRGASGGIFWL